MYVSSLELKYGVILLLTVLLPVLTTTQKCLSCSYISRLWFCDRVTYCEQGEICHIRKILTRNGHTQFSSGCISDTTCSVDGSLHGSFGTPYGHVTCVECCHGDFCNNKGCGDPGPPPRDSRGPLCFQCNNVTSPVECQTLVACSSGQVCSIQESLSDDGTSVFNGGCVSQNTCPQPARPRRLMEGDTAPSRLCHTCCSTDYCNSDCSS